jgi:carbamoyltransferase
MTKSTILGLNDGFAATACSLIDGETSLMIAEERFTKKKNCSGVPEKALEWMMPEQGINASEIEAIGIPWESVPFKGISDYKKSRHKYFDLLNRFLPSAIIGSDLLIRNVVNRYKASRKNLEEFQPILKKLGISQDKVDIWNHHQCHAAASLYGSDFHNKHKESLVVTLDGSGDGDCMSIWKANGSNMSLLNRQNSYHSIGIMVARLTQMMGMKPHEHEYKLMGMAPYGGGFGAEQAYEIFKNYFSLSADGLHIQNNMGVWGQGMVIKMHHDFFQVRFDSICYGIQKLLEELVIQLVVNWCKHTGIRNICVGGGIFMNVKLNKILSQLDEIDDFYVVPSCGDDSIALGAAYLSHQKRHPGENKPLGQLYLGYQISESEIIEVLNKNGTKVEWKKCDDISKETAKLLHADKIVARCKGRSEWGARALGNRSIMCNPMNAHNIHRINKAVKKRDFWMPFCPSILEDAQDDYLINPKNREAPYMILAFDTTEKATKDIICGLHPFDKTARPQIVSAKNNPVYHKLLKDFQELSGVGGIVNTSFNLHGLPIVNDANDAMHVLLNSELDYLAIEDYLVWKK